MAEKQSGPVKPPTLDMQARKPSPRTPGKSADNTSADKSAAAPKSKSTTEKAQSTSESTARASENQKTEPPRRSSPPRSAPSPAPFPFIPAVVSAVIGAAVAVFVILGLAITGTLSTLMPQTTGDQAERLTFAEEQVSEALVGFNALNRQVSDLQTRTGTNLDQLTARQDELQAAIDNLPASGPAEPVDLSGIQSQIDQLGTRIAAMQSGASSEDADALSGELTEMRTSLSAMTEKVDALDLNVTQLGDNLNSTNEGLLTESAVITSLQADIEALESEPSLPSADSQLLRLPLALSGLETALEAARPFSTQLQSLLNLVPALTASDDLTAAAETGLPAPGRIVTDFSRTVPAMMAARPADPDAGLMDNLLARAQALLAIRPTGETGTDPITDTLARAEQALEIRQFASAADALSQLPAPMQQAAGDTLTAITLMAEAETLLSDARASVLGASATSGTAEADGAAE